MALSNQCDYTSDKLLHVDTCSRIVDMTVHTVNCIQRINNLRYPSPFLHTLHHTKPSSSTKVIRCSPKYNILLDNKSNRRRCNQ